MENGDDQEKSDESVTLDKLPSDILLLIFKYVNQKMLGRLAQVCTIFNEVVNSEILWVKASQKCLATNLIKKEILYR